VKSLLLLLLLVGCAAPRAAPATDMSVVATATAYAKSRIPSPTPKPVPTPTPKPEPTAMSKIGDTVGKGNWGYLVTETAREKTITWSDFGNKTTAKGIWQIVHVRVLNISKETLPINTWDFEVKDAKGITYKADLNSITYSSYKNLSKPMDNYPPGVPAEIALIFDVNPEATGLKQ
jgi:hypothetical protein